MVAAISSAWVGKWCSSAPRLTPARCCTATVVVAAVPCLISEVTAASRIRRRVASSWDARIDTAGLGLVGIEAPVGDWQSHLTVKRQYTVRLDCHVLWAAADASFAHAPPARRS